MIKVENITKRYGATVAVDDVSFEVDHGEIVGFLGPNGAGKSTTIKILTGYVVADSGNVVIDGNDVLEDSLAVKKSIGYLPETTPLYAEMQVGEYLRFMGKARQIPGSQLKGQIDRVVELVGIERMLRKNIAFLSKGYKQRVGLAQALIHDPPVIIMDEPTSGLDPHQIIEIRELIRELGKTKLVMLSSHILQEISAICTRILIIKEGQLVADGTPDNLEKSVADQQIFKVRLKGEESEVVAGLEGLEGVDHVEVVGQGDNYEEFRVSGRTGKLLGVHLSQLAFSKNWELSSLSQQHASLEDVYLQLTASSPAKAAS